MATSEHEEYVRRMGVRHEPEVAGTR